MITLEIAKAEVYTEVLSIIQEVRSGLLKSRISDNRLKVKFLMAIGLVRTDLGPIRADIAHCCIDIEENIATCAYSFIPHVILSEDLSELRYTLLDYLRKREKLDLLGGDEELYNAIMRINKLTRGMVINDFEREVSNIG